MQKISYLAYPMIFLVLTSCQRYIDWLGKTFRQVEKNPPIMQAYTRQIKTKNVYDQFTTIGLIDVIWLNENTKKDLKADIESLGLTSDIIVDKFDTFYVLMPNDNIKDTVLTPINGFFNWQVFLEINGKLHKPLNNEQLLEFPEFIKETFTERANRFRDLYKIDFDINLEKFDTFKLKILSIRYNIEFIWRKNEHKKEINCCNRSQRFRAEGIYKK